MRLRNANLNLLPILQALLHERSVSAAAERLAMSQSATSEALAKLRVALDDPLLVRVGGSMKLTPRAVALLDPVDELCRAAETLMQRPSIDAANTERIITVASADYAVSVVGTRILAHMREKAPRVIVRFVNMSDDLIPSLASGAVDFALIPEFFIDVAGPAPIRFSPLFRDRAIVVIDAKHPLAEQKSISHQDLAPYRMVAFYPSVKRIEQRDANAFSAGAAFRVSAFVPMVALAPPLIRDTLDFTVLPARYRIDENSYPSLVDRPFTSETPPLQIVLAWGAAQDADAVHRWLRDMLIEAASDPKDADESTARP